MGNFFASFNKGSDAMKSIGEMGKAVAENKGVKLTRTEEVDLARSKSRATTFGIRTDKKLDKKLRKEPKQLMVFYDQLDYLKTLQPDDPNFLYWGNREEIIRMILTDPAGLLKEKAGNKRDQDTYLFGEVNYFKDAKYFIIRVHPKTLH